MSYDKEEDFMGECMGSEDMILGYPNQRARAKICTARLCNSLPDRIKAADISHTHEKVGFAERLTVGNFVQPQAEDYVDFAAGRRIKRYEYRDPKTGEVFYYDRVGFYKKDGRTLIFVASSEIVVDSPFRVDGGSRDYVVYEVHGGDFLKVNKDNV